jgi:CD109 antigen
MKFTLPDAITTWDVSGFSLSEKNGLGISEPLSLVSEKPFYILVNLPYSVRVDELLKVEVLIFNNKNDISEADIKFSVVEDAEETEAVGETTEKSYEFYSSCRSGIINHRELSNHVKTPANLITETHFYIKNKKPKDIKLRLIAIANGRVLDEVIKVLKVVDEGIVTFDNMGNLFDLRNQLKDSLNREFGQVEDLKNNSLKVKAPKN